MPRFLKRHFSRRRNDRLLYFFEDFALDTDRRELRRGSTLVAMSPQAFDFLTYLVCNRVRVVSRDDLISAIWDGRAVSESALSTCINAARSAIDDTGEGQRLIRTLPRKGVRFIGAVREEHNPEAVIAGTAAPELPAPTLPLPDRPSIAVLPFTNMSGEPEQDYFADGMAEEIITALSRCAWLFVIARNSSFIYKGRAVDVRQVGRELGVRYVLEGSVRRGGDRLRFTGQLIDATNGLHIWADRFEGDMGDVFGLQDQFTESVVGAIEPKVQLAEIERLKHRPTTNLDVYDLLLRAQQLEYQFTEESIAAAFRHLDQALLIDPSYAPAMALAALCYVDRWDQGWTKDPDREAKDGLRLASRAVEFGKDDGNVLWMAAVATLRLQMNAHRARELAYRSLELNPNSAVALSVAGRIEVSLGNAGKGLELLLRAERLSPRDPKSWFILGGGTASAYFAQGRFDEAASACKRALIMNPRYTLGLRTLAACLVKQARPDDAAEVMREVLNIEPHLTLTKLRARSMQIEENLWNDYAAALRLAGLPE
jgi:TolB-like protein/tetratricopeptide (TPR) repeat protein